MLIRRWPYPFMALALGLASVLALLSRSAAAQSPEPVATPAPAASARTPLASSPASASQTGSLGGNAQANAPAGPSVVLYDQYNNASSQGTSSQNFEPSLSAFGDFTADDFGVPGGQAWALTSAQIKGVYFNGTGPATSMNVFFYSNAITTPTGITLTARMDVSYTQGVTNTDFVIPLNPPVILTPGSYWISVQANQVFSTGGQFAWTNRTVTSTNPAAWQNPAGGFAACPTWNRRTLCVAGDTAPDQVFSLGGISDTLRTVQFSAPTYSVNEGDGSASIAVTLSGPSALTATVRYATANLTALAGYDYLTATGTLTFSPGITSQMISVPILDDAQFEDSEMIAVALSGATGATIGSPSFAQLTILDNDPPPPLTCGGPGPWVLRNFLPVPVYGSGVTSDGTYAYSVGGFNLQTGSDVPQMARYDPVANIWTPLAAVPYSVTMASAVYAPTNNKLYVFGGELVAGGAVTRTTRIYDVASNTWSIGAPMPDQRAFMGSGYYNGKIYLAGGYSTGSVVPSFAQTWEYDVQADTWLTKTAMPQPLGGAGSAVAKGHLYVIGGRDGASQARSQTYDYDIANDSWSSRTNAPVGVNVPATAVLGGKIWVLGGGAPFVPVRGPALLDSAALPSTFFTTMVYDPAVDGWLPGPSLTIPRSFVGAISVRNFGVAIGGYTGFTTTGATEVTQFCSSKLYLPLVMK